MADTLKADGEISAEALRKAEEYVQQEEGAGNRLTGRVGTIVTAIAVAMTLFHLYAAYDIVPTIPLRYTHVAFVLLLSFLLFPVANRFRNRIMWFDVIPPLLGIVVIVYAIMQGDDFTDRAAVPERWDVILGAIFIVLVLEAARRTTGWIMPFVAVLFILYAYFGPDLPPPWTHRGYDIPRLVGHLFITLEGIFGVPVDVSATLIIMFTIYGAILQHSGAGKFFIDFSLGVMGNKPSSAGRAVVASSFLLGGPSGSGVATTVMIGTVAWPMLKKAGFEPNAGGGLLAAGGLGAIISPPVLGAAAFLIAEFLKISYLDVIWMATIPTLLYYLSLLFMVELDSLRFGAHEVVFKPEMTVPEMTRRYGFHFVSLVAVVVFMVIGYSPMLSVFYSTVLAFGMSALAPETTLGPRKVLIPLLLIGFVAAAAFMIPAIGASTFASLFEILLPVADLLFDRGVGHYWADPSRPADCAFVQELDGRDGRRLGRRVERGDYLCGRRHYRRHRHAHRPRSEILRHRHRFCRRQPAADRDLYLAGGLDHRPRGAGDGVLHHLRGDRGAGLNQAGRAGFRRAYVHLLLRGAVGSVAADRAVALRGRRHHRRRSLRHHHAGLEIHAAGVPGAVRIRTRSAGRRPADEYPKDGSVYDIVWVTLKTGIGTGRARRGGAELGAAKKYSGGTGAFGSSPGFCWCFRACSRAWRKRLPASTCRIRRRSVWPWGWQSC